MPSYGVFGWQKPCHLLQEGYASSFEELLAETRWEGYGPTSGNPACRDCMVHSGFGASAVEEGLSSWRGFIAMARAALAGPRIGAPPAGRLAAPKPADAPAVTPGAEVAASPEALDAAFRFRGDVTLVLDDGSAVEGSVAAARPEEVTFWPREERRARRLASGRIRQVRFSDRDLSGRGRDRLERAHVGRGE